MFYKYLSAALFCATALLAEQIDNIEFSLPHNQTKKWQVVNQVENSCGAAIIFSLEDKGNDEDPYFGYSSYQWNDEDESDQLFYATCRQVPFNPHLSAKTLEDQLALVFPFIKYQFYLVEQDEDSSLFEFYGFKEDRPLCYGMLRNLLSAQGTVTLTYMTDIDEKTPQARKRGMGALRQAHIR